MKLKRFFTYFFRIALLLLLILWVVFRFFLNMQKDDAEVAKYFEELQMEAPSSHFVEENGYRLHYKALERSGGLQLVFVHGSPGSWDAFLNFFADSLLRNQASLYSVDRLGYGRTEAGQPESSLHKQAEAILPLLQKLDPARPRILVGHSMGGPIVFRLAMDYPQWVDGVVSVAGLTDPKLESRPAILYPLRSKALRWLLPPDMDVCNREILPLKGELEFMKPLWKNIQASCYIMQGDADMLVAEGHADFAEQQLVNANFTSLRLAGENHFTIWTRPELVKRAVFCLAEEIDTAYTKFPSH